MTFRKWREWLVFTGHKHSLSIAGVLLGIIAAAVIPASSLYVQPEDGTGHGAVGEARYACPMLCVVTDHPGKCPQCGMDMEPISDYGGAVTREQAAMIGLEVAQVRRIPLERRLQTVGRIELDDTLTQRLTAWIPGRIDRMYQKVIGSVVREGDPLIEVFSPSLFAAQQEHLSNLRSLESLPQGSALRSDLSRVVDLSRDRLQLLGMTPEQVQQIEVDGAQTRTLITSPRTGVIIERFVDEGEYVREGTPLLKIASLGQLWLFLDVYEMDLPLIRVGQPVAITTRANPGPPVPGTVDFIEPTVDPRTRTTRVRVTLENPVKRETSAPPSGMAPPRRFAPGMFADASMRLRLGAEGEVPDDAVEIEAQPEVVAVPVEAVLDSGVRTVVYVRTGASDNGATFELSEVELGSLGEGPDGRRYRVVLEGLSSGQYVATNGNFLLDSQSQLQGNRSLFFPQGTEQAVDPHAGHNH